MPKTDRTGTGKRGRTGARNRQEIGRTCPRRGYLSKQRIL
jgi:hypothetical protein